MTLQYLIAEKRLSGNFIEELAKIDFGLPLWNYSFFLE